MDAPDDITVLSLDDSWTYKTVLLADLISRKVSTVLHEFSDLNLSQWRVMIAVADQPGRTASAVVDLTPMDKGIVSRAVRTLVEKEIIERRSSKEDGRLSHLFLTTSGQTLYSEIVKAMDQGGASGRQLLTRQQQTDLMAVLDEAITKYR
ncbi:MAG: MarR family winged helix-turn-helix transcriptional regulator [Pseudomonadota bacterium]